MLEPGCEAQMDAAQMDAAQMDAAQMDAAQVDAAQGEAEGEAQVETQADRGRQRINAATERLCIATRTLRPVSQMIRFVAGPDGAVVPDLKRKLPGRGVWVTARRDIVAQAVRRGAFGRALK